MDVQPHHRVLDMCAAPGSKTFQLLEALHAAGDGGALPTGLVVANDADLKRCNLLVHQTKRANSPALIVTNHEAQFFPLIKGPPGSGDEAGYLFDRILCDVPCSGDGTLRKNPDLWRRWNVGLGMGLHTLQVRIALHAARLLRLGGRMVYSTCSLNPIENEAVVAEILRHTGGALALLDCSAQYPEFKRNPGMRSWKAPPPRAGRPPRRATRRALRLRLSARPAGMAAGARQVWAADPGARGRGAAPQERAGIHVSGRRQRRDAAAPLHAGSAAPRRHGRVFHLRV